jgi:hypothetical protein
MLSNGYVVEFPASAQGASRRDHAEIAKHGHHEALSEGEGEGEYGMQCEGSGSGTTNAAPHDNI